MAISWITVSPDGWAATPGGSGTSVPATAIPVGHQAGDLLIIQMTLSRAAMAFGESSYAGWTMVRDEVDLVDGAMWSRIIWKKATSSSETSPAFTSPVTSGNMIASVSVYRGVDIDHASGPFIAENFTLEPSTTTAHTGPTLNNTDANAWGVFFGASRGAAIASWTVNSPLTLRNSDDSGGVNSNTAAHGIGDTNGTIATGNHTWSGASSNSTNAATIWAAILRPAGAGGSVPTGTATGSWTFTGAAAGKRTPKASAAGTWAVSGVASGKRTPRATAVGSWSFAGTASGKRVAKGTATGSWSFAGAAAGKRTPKATATGTWTFTGVAVGTTTRRGSAAGGYAWTGAAAGSRPGLAVPAGTATGSWTFTGVAAGKRTPKASATGTWAVSGVASGKRNPKASAAGTWTFAGVAAGRKLQRGTATSSWIITGAAVGSKLQRGSTSGAWTFSSDAIGRALLPPTGLTVTPVSVSQLDLSWNSVSGATGYDIERDGVVIVTDHPTITYSDTGLAEATAFTYRVRATAGAAGDWNPADPWNPPDSWLAPH